MTAMYADKIATLFRECKLLGDRGVNPGKKSSHTIENTESKIDERSGTKIQCNNSQSRQNVFVINSGNEDSREILSKDVEDLVSGTKIRTASVEFASLSKMMAMASLAAGDETSAVGFLIESHATILKQHIYHRYTKSQVRYKYLNQPQNSGLNPAHTKLHPKSGEAGDSLREKLARMPHEWYMVQLTVGYKEPHPPRGNDSVLQSTHFLHVTVLPTGEDGIEPFCITVPKPNNGDFREYDGIAEIIKIQKTNKADLEAFYSTNASYWKMRDKQNQTMKTAMMELENSWLREWRILLIADPSEDSMLVKQLRSMIDKLIADDLSVINVSARSRWLLQKIATSCFSLSKVEIARAVKYVLRGCDKLANNVILSIYGKLNDVNELRTERRKTTVLIVDECIDHIPFETMEVLKSHPVTRFPSFHIAYAMFKEHENTIVDGCKIINRASDFGTFIINPARNLNKMEKRMKLFIDYWLPEWSGKYGIQPDEEYFENILVNKDILMYSGHGSGIQYLSGEKIERLRVRATVLLFGCSSVKLYSTGGRYPPYGVSNQYLIACSPCILGMLWEVTDSDTDRMTARFMSDWISSDGEKSWSEIDINRWCDGALKFKTSSTTDKCSSGTNEPELLRAVARSKEVCAQHMTSAAVIVRGLPIKLQ